MSIALKGLAVVLYAAMAAALYVPVLAMVGRKEAADGRKGWNGGEQRKLAFSIVGGAALAAMVTFLFLAR